MKHIELNTQGDAVKHFFLSLRSDPEVSTIMLDGRLVARVFPAEECATAAASATDPWTESKNERRCDLVDKEIEVGLAPEEISELMSLEQQMDHHLRSVAPLPLDEARRLYAKLLVKADAAPRP